MKALLALAFAAAMAGPAVAQQVRDCDWLASAWNLAEPWEENTRTFANGAVRLALLDAIEPGAVPFHLLVLSPPWDERLQGGVLRTGLRLSPYSFRGSGC